MSKSWVVKSGNWYLHDSGWFKPQRYAHRFKTRLEAKVMIDEIKATGFDARIVRIVPKTDDWVVRFEETGQFVLDAFVNEDGEPDCFVTGDPKEATRFEPTAALIFAQAYNELCRREGIGNCWMEAVPCSKL